MARVRGFGDLVFFASAMWIKALIGIIAISVIFYMIVVIAEDPEILHLEDGFRFVRNLLRRTWSFLRGRRPLRGQLHAQDRGSAVLRTADRHDGPSADGKPDGAMICEAEPDGGRPHADDSNLRKGSIGCHWCSGPGYVACRLCQKMCCYKQHYDQKLEVCTACSSSGDRKNEDQGARRDHENRNDVAGVTISPWIASAGQGILWSQDLKHLRRMEILSGRLETVMAGAEAPLLPSLPGESPSRPEP